MLSPDRPEHLSEATIHYGLYGKKEKEIRKTSCAFTLQSPVLARADKSNFD